MPRGAKLDREATQLAREASRKGHGYIPPADALHYNHSPLRTPLFLTDRRSFVTTTGHVRLYGRDMGLLRTAVYDQGPFCSECGALTRFHANLADPLRAELAHKESRSARADHSAGCDCRHNVRILCARHHRGKEGEHA